MNDLNNILKQISYKKFCHNVSRKTKKRLLRKNRLQKRIEQKKEYLLKLKREFNGSLDYENILLKWLPANLLYILKAEKSDFFINKIKFELPKHKKKFASYKILRVPKQFSLIDHPKESFAFINEVLVTLLFGKYKSVDFTYEDCNRLDIGAQVLLDVILNEVIVFFRKCSKNKFINKKIVPTKSIGLTNIRKNLIDINKILFSVGSPAIHSKTNFNFTDIIPYGLHSYSQTGHFNLEKAQEQKDIETTKLAEYVQDSLNRLNKKLTPEKLDNLCIVIGETLINAEEHSTTKHRFSIGYFQESKIDGKHFGVFRLIIMNFGKTIYEKFKDPNCPNQQIVQKMRELSNSYRNKKYYVFSEFEEEELWTLYALQERVTSVSTKDYKKRGNGSIRFIENFFDIKGTKEFKDELSRMTILSGNTSITFDGTYGIEQKITDNDTFKVMTFNESGNIEDKPDKNFVKAVANYFPGTVISAKIYFEEDDLTDEPIKG